MKNNRFSSQEIIDFRLSWWWIVDNDSAVDICIVWKRVVLPAFRRYMLPTSSWSKSLYSMLHIPSGRPQHCSLAPDANTQEREMRLIKCYTKLGQHISITPTVTRILCYTM
jgi:hypothetical protein